MKVELDLSIEEIDSVEKSLDAIILTFFSVEYFKDTIWLLNKIAMKIKAARNLKEQEALKSSKGMAVWDGTSVCRTPSCGHKNSAHSKSGICSIDGCSCCDWLT